MAMAISNTFKDAKVQRIGPLIRNAPLCSNPRLVSRKFTFCFVGWLEPNKGVMDILAAIDLINEDFEFIFLGGGSLEFEVRKSSQSDTRISDLGWKPNDEVLGYFDRVDCLVMASYSEGLPNSIVEAMCAGLAVLSSNVGEISDFIDEKSLFDAGDQYGLASRMVELMASPEKLKEQKNRNFQRSLEFGVAAFDQKIFGALKNVE